MKSAVVLLQLAVLCATWFKSGLQAEQLLILYAVNFVVVAAYFRARLRRSNWFLNQGFLFLLIYSIYYPLTGAMLLASGIELLPRDFVQIQLRYSVLCLAAFSLAYISISQLRSEPNDRHQAQQFSRGFSYIVLVPVMLLSPIYRVVLMWWGSGFSSSYTDRYLGIMRLVESGNAIFVQIANQVTPVSFAALTLFFSREVDRGRYRYAALTLMFFLWYSWITGARTNFLAPALLFVIIFARSHRISFDLKRAAIAACIIVFYFGLERARSNASEEESTFAIVGEAFVIFSNPLIFNPTDGGSIPRPPINTYVNDLTKIFPGYIYQTGQENSLWYMREFFLDSYEQGHGRAFGFNTEAMINFGERSIVFQAVVLGVVLALLTGGVVSRFDRSPYMVVYNVLLVTNTYLLVRLGTFAFLSSVIPLAIALFLIRLTQQILVNASRRPAAG